MVVSRRCFAGSWSRRWSRVSEAVDAAPVQQRPPLGPAQSQPHGMVSGEQADHQCRNPPPALAVQATPAVDAAAPDPRKRCGCAGGSGFARWVWSLRRLVLGVYAQGFGLDAQGVDAMTHPRGFMCCHDVFVGSDEIKLYNSQPGEDSDMG